MSWLLGFSFLYLQPLWKSGHRSLGYFGCNGLFKLEVRFLLIYQIMSLFFMQTTVHWDIEIDSVIVLWKEYGRIETKLSEALIN